jgi:2-oxoisovalerate dehydrogenase E1 component alpha subunit
MQVSTLPPQLNPRSYSFGTNILWELTSCSRNNGYAISTPQRDQYRGDGIVARAQGYGIPGFRVDGNDILANYVTTKMARDIALKRNTPVLIEAITYRVGHHSTSDDSSTYRPKAEVEEWIKGNAPIDRFRKYLEDKKWWSKEQEDEERKAIRKQVINAMLEAEKEKKPPVSAMFDDVYEELPWHLQEQKAELKSLLQEHPQSFPHLDQYLPWKE